MVAGVGTAVGIFEIVGIIIATGLVVCIWRGRDKSELSDSYKFSF